MSIKGSKSRVTNHKAYRATLDRIHRHSLQGDCDEVLCNMTTTCPNCGKIIREGSVCFDGFDVYCTQKCHDTHFQSDDDILDEINESP